jgi:hypothetical protein
MIGFRHSTGSGGGGGLAFAGALALVGAARIGQSLGLSVPPLSDGGTGALSYQWRRDGQPIAGATAATLLLTPADDLARIDCVVTAVSDGRTAVGSTPPAIARHAAPETSGPLPDEVFDGWSGPQTIDAAAAFSGAALVYALEPGAGPEIALDPATGRLTVETDAPFDGRVLAVTAANSGGTARTTVTVTVEAAPPAPDLYREDMTALSVGDGTAAILSGADLAPLSRGSPPADPFDSPGVVAAPSDAGRKALRLLRTDRPKYGFLVDAVQTRLAAGWSHLLVSGTLDTAGTRDWKEGAIGLQPDLSAGAIAFGLEIRQKNDAQQFLARVDGAVAGSTTDLPRGAWDFEIGIAGPQIVVTVWPHGQLPEDGETIVGEHAQDVPQNATLLFWSEAGHALWEGVEISVWDAPGASFPPFDIDAPPILTGASPVPWHGVETWDDPAAGDVTLDFSAAFAAADGQAITGYRAATDHPHAWSGAALTLSAGTVTAPDALVFPVTALNDTAESAPIETRAIVRPAPAPLAPSGDLPGFVVEAGRPVPVVDLTAHVAGGLPPFSFAAVSAPGWLTLEANGVCWGYAPPVPAGPETLILRVTDRRGDSADIVWTVETVARRSRTPTVVAGPTEQVRSVLARCTEGDVVRFPAGWAGTWGNDYRIARFDPRDPVIVTADPGVVLPRHGRMEGCHGVIFDAVDFSAAPTVTGDQAFKNASHLHFYDCSWTGETVTVDPGDGQPWMTADTFAHSGQGPIPCRWGTIHGGRVRHVHTGCERPLSESGIFGLTIEDVRDDLLTVGATTAGGVAEGFVLAGIRGRRFSGNHLSTEHRDLLQGIGDAGPARRAVIADCFLSGAGTGAQGLFWEHDGWPPSDRLPDDAHRDIVIRDTVILSAGYKWLFLLGAHLNARIDRVVAVIHPDGAPLGVVAEQEPSEAAFVGCLLQTAPAMTEATLADSVILADLADPAEVFPNWGDVGAAYEDPRAAVADGGAPHAARFWIDPTSAFALAHPAVGPAWLRGG